jgi:hypothetical protein
MALSPTKKQKVELEPAEPVITAVGFFDQWAVNVFSAVNFWRKACSTGMQGKLRFFFEPQRIDALLVDDQNEASVCLDTKTGSSKMLDGNYVELNYLTSCFDAMKKHQQNISATAKKVSTKHLVPVYASFQEVATHTVTGVDVQPLETLTGVISIDKTHGVELFEGETGYDLDPNGIFWRIDKDRELKAMAELFGMKSDAATLKVIEKAVDATALQLMREARDQRLGKKPAEGTLLSDIVKKVRCSPSNQTDAAEAPRLLVNISFHLASRLFGRLPNGILPDSTFDCLVIHSCDPSSPKLTLGGGCYGNHNGRRDGAVGGQTRPSGG